MIMDADILKKYKLAGQIDAKVTASVLVAAKPGARLLDLAELAERKIKELGGMPAFPVNISVNDLAAHYTPTPNDQTVINPGDVVKIDIGTHVDGYIGDMAVTYCSERNPLVDASQKVLQAAIDVARPGATPSEIGSAIESKAKDLGFGVIVNLTGHGLDRFVFHGFPSIPNTSVGSDYQFQDGDVIAIEPFVTASNSQVKESGFTEIYRYLMDKPVRLLEARKILAMARDQWMGLPFAKRWLSIDFSPIKISMALRQLEQVEAIESYPALKHVSGQAISQAEHTIIIKDKPIITTLLE